LTAQKIIELCSFLGILGELLTIKTNSIIIIIISLSDEFTQRTKHIQSKLSQLLLKNE